MAGGGFAYTRAVCVNKKLGGLQVLMQYPFVRHLDLSQNCIQEPLRALRERLRPLLISFKGFLHEDVRPIGSLRHLLSLNLRPQLDFSVSLALL